MIIIYNIMLIYYTSNFKNVSDGKLYLKCGISMLNCKRLQALQ